MKKEFFEKIHNKTLAILRSKNNELPLKELSKYNCSEMSRLVGCWVMEHDNDYVVTIFKGENLILGDLAHDLLVLEGKGIFYVLDPTVWQFFPEEKNVLVFSGKNKSEVTLFLEHRYGGIWKLSERMVKVDCVYRDEWLEIITKNSNSI